MFDLHHLLIRMFTHHCPVCCSEFEALGSWHKQRIHYFLEKICTFVLYYHKMSQYQSIYMLHEVLTCMELFKSKFCVHDKCIHVLYIKTANLLLLLLKDAMLSYIQRLSSSFAFCWKVHWDFFICIRVSVSI